MSQNTNESHLTGLTDQEVIASREKNGVNLLTPPKTSFHYGNFIWRNFRILLSEYY